MRSARNEMAMVPSIVTPGTSRFAGIVYVLGRRMINSSAGK